MSFPVCNSEPYPSNGVTTGRFVPSETDSDDCTENKEHHERLSVGLSSCVQMVVICDQKVPRLCSVTGRILCEASHSHGDSRQVIRC